MTFLDKMRSRLPIGAEIDLSTYLYDGTYSQPETFEVIDVNCSQGDEDRMVVVAYRRIGAKGSLNVMVFTPGSMDHSKNDPQQRINQVRPKEFS